MPARSDITELDLRDASAFEVTDLGACSYLDGQSERAAASRWAVPDRAAGLRVVPQSGVRAAPRPGLRSDALKPREGAAMAPNERGASPSASKKSAGHPLAKAPGSTPESVFRADTVPVGAPPLRPTHSDSDSARRAADRLDAALLDFAGESEVRSANQALELIYGAVFDPEERAAERGVSERESPSTGPHRAVSDEPKASFSWDDDALDAPIDPEDVRRRLGTRVVGVPQAGILRRARGRKTKAE